MTSALLIFRLEQVRAHLDVEHKYLVDQVYEALAAPADPTARTGDIPPLSGPSPQETSGQGAAQFLPHITEIVQPINNNNATNVLPFPGHSVKVGGAA